MDWVTQIDMLIDTARDAGKAILEVYDTDFAVEHKEDKSPLTEADQRSNAVIAERLASFGLPILSEESRQLPFAERRDWKQFWLIDPLDGTKEFVKRNGEFTVNIALIDSGRPILGVVYAPVLERFYYAVNGKSYRLEKGTVEPLPCEQPDGYVVVASRSHMSSETQEFVDERKKQHPELTLRSIGSALKLCLVAEGSADCYPRLAPTMEWDTGAAHAVVNGAGKRVLHYGTDRELVYNKENLVNPFFLVE